MDISVSQKSLAKVLNDCARVASVRAGLPVLGNILLKTTGSKLYIAATNLEIATTANINAKINKHGEITVPAKLITEFVSNLPNETVEINTKNNSLHIICGGYKSSLNGIEAGEFPELPTIDEKNSVRYMIAADTFKKSTTQTIFTCSNDNTRPVLTGVYWHSYDKGLYIAGTDGYRLAEKKVTSTESELTAIVPVNALQEVLRTIHDDISEIEVLFDKTQVKFRIGTSEITSRLIEGNYPDYRKLIPTQNPTKITTSLTDCVRMAKLASLFAREAGGSITITSDSESSHFSIKSTASERGENTSEIKATVAGGGSVSLNSRYLIDVLSVVDTDSITIEYGAKLAPITIRPASDDTDYLAIIMPLKS